ncbi:MAG: DUF805 domain-containing protein [Roseicyclus sp.]|nr:DUF805 domain-containing protein [Roseicyclus sp.]
MGPIKAVAACYVRMFNFTGRARRAEYWWFAVWQIVLGMGMGGYYGFQTASRLQNDPAFAAMMQRPDEAEAYIIGQVAPYALPIAFGYLVLLVIPSLSVTIRRLHDTDRSGWNIFMPTLVAIVSGIIGAVMMGASAATGSAGGAMLSMLLISIPTFIASIWFLVWLCLPGTRGDNRFGGDPISDRKAPIPFHPAFAGELQGEERDRAEVARRAAARDYYKRRVLPSIQSSSA